MSITLFHEFGIMISYTGLKSYMLFNGQRLNMNIKTKINLTRMA